MGGLYKKFWKNSVQYGFQAPLVTLVILYFLFIWMPTHGAVTGLVWGFILALLPFALPVLLGELALHAWQEYKRQEDYWSTEYTVLEIRLPEDITQSPYAAELFLRVLYQTGEVDTPAHGTFSGKTAPWFSLEIVSTEGVVRFYVWTRTRYKEIVKAQMYAHYPTVQVVEVPDYTLAVPYDPAAIDVWGITQTLQKPDPYPIMTYIAWQLDKEKKEEFKSDPLLSLIEFFGSIGPGEHLWSQIILRGHTECPWAEEETGHALSLDKWVEHEKDNILEKTVTDEATDKPNYSRLSMGDKDLIDSMERKLNKQIFDVGIRTLYVARHENRQSIRNSGVPTAFRSFEHGSEGRGLNGLKPQFYVGPFFFPWHDFLGIRKAKLKRRMYEGYVTRQFFYEPYHDYHIALNSEEIASLWHLPGKVAHTPTLVRMPSRRAEAPANLPT